MCDLKYIIIFLFILNKFYLGRCTVYLECHNDPLNDPAIGPAADLMFSWLGTLQYIHVKDGTPHYFRVPRVVLISREYAISTAVDASEIPDGYALGNIILDDYERDITECGITLEEFATDAARCDPAILMMPIADVLLHPEYQYENAKNSLALLKLLTSIKSRYVLPICLPIAESTFDPKDLTRKKSKYIYQKLFHVDYDSDVPRDLDNEEKDVSQVFFLPADQCDPYNNTDYNATYPVDMENRVCSTGCGFHSGAPTVVHEQTGFWAVVALAQGGTPCPDPLRPRSRVPPARHILVFPYVHWILTKITDWDGSPIDKDDPFGFMSPVLRTSAYNPNMPGWIGHWYFVGIRCFDRGEPRDDLKRSYHEIFVVKPRKATHFTYYLELAIGDICEPVCVKVGMPFQFGRAKVWGLDTKSVKVMIPTVEFVSPYRFQVEMWCFYRIELTTEPDISESDLI